MAVRIGPLADNLKGGRPVHPSWPLEFSHRHHWRQQNIPRLWFDGYFQVESVRFPVPSSSRFPPPPSCRSCPVLSGPASLFLCRDRLFAPRTRPPFSPLERCPRVHAPESVRPKHHVLCSPKSSFALSCPTRLPDSRRRFVSSLQGPSTSSRSSRTSSSPKSFQVFLVRASGALDSANGTGDPIRRESQSHLQQRQPPPLLS